ncbi:PH-like domain-containing protein [Arthrobacter sp. D2-10]
MDVAITAVAISLAAIVLLAGLMAVGWRNRLKRQQTLSAPADAPEDRGAPVYAAEGQYVVTTTGGDWLDRVTAHGLGNKATATAAVYSHGLLFDRSGDTEVYIARQNLTGVRLERGMAGKFVEKDGLVVVSWTMDSHIFDTGFRTRYAADKPQLLAAISELIEDTDPLTNPTSKEVQ